MKKFLSFLICIGIFMSSLILPAFAQGDNEGTIFDGPGLEGGLDLLRPELEGTGIGNKGGLVTAILFWVKILLIIAGVLAFVAFIWAGFLFITTFANEENNEKAKKIMIYAAIGIIVILVSYTLTNLFITAAV